jgi:hypothetical protein
MPICPKCMETIESLSFSRDVIERGARYFGIYGISEKVNVRDEVDIEYWCPKCKESIVNSQDEADEFLRGEARD